MSRFAAGALWAVAAVAIVLLFLSVYPVRGFDQPRGYDTPRYLWRTNCGAAGGLDELRRCAPSEQAALPSRVGYPLVALLLDGVLPTSTVTLAAILPAAAAAAIALAAAALISFSLGLRPGSAAAVALVIGASPVVVAMAIPEAYADTMLAVAMGIGGLVAFSVFVLRGEGGVAAAVLLAVTAVVHWPTAALMGGILVGVGLLGLVPMGAVDAGGVVLARRAAIVFGLGAGLWASVLLVMVGVPPDSFHIPRSVLDEKLRSHLPRFGLPVALPAAVLGAVALARGRVGEPDGSDGRRRTLLLAILLVWVGLVALAVLAWFSGLSFPVHRFVLLSVPVPALAAIGLLWLATAARGRSTVLATVVQAAGCVAVLGVGFLLLLRSPRPVMRSERIDAAATAASYLERMVPEEATVIVVADDRSSPLDILTQTFRAAVPAERIASLQLRRKPPPDGDEVVLVVRGYSADFDRIAGASAERVAAPGVVVLSGPVPASALPPVRGPRMETRAIVLFLEGLAALAVLVLSGLGWAAAAVGRALRPADLLAVAPAFGLAALVVAGLVADELGLRLTGGIAAAVVVGTAMAGGLAGAWRTSATKSRPAGRPGG